MCAVIGVSINSPTEEHFELVRRVIVESSIRGLHATGISFVKGHSVETIKEPIGAKEFVEKHLKDMSQYVSYGRLAMVAHCRYSTSDLEYNQPISDETWAVAHNGVVTQELFEKWATLFDYKGTNRNDTALILETLAQGKEPLAEWPDSSMAVCTLDNNGELTVFRNGKRPLYVSFIGKGYIVTSTKDIALRAGISENNIRPIDMDTYMTIITHEGMNTVNYSYNKSGNKDLQNVR